MGHAARSSRRESHAAASDGAAWRQHVKSGVLLLAAAVSLYVLLPTLASVLASWRSLSHLDWLFAVLAVACEAASLVCLWELDRIAPGTRARFPVACAQLAGNAAGRLVPGAATPVAVDMLRRAGFDAGRATAALTASTGLQLGTTQRLLNATLRRDRHVVGLPQQLLADRDFIRTTLGGRWKPAVVVAAANAGFDYLALLCALRAVGAAPDPRWFSWPTPPQSCSGWCRLRPVAWALWRQGWSARSSSPVSRDRRR